LNNITQLMTIFTIIILFTGTISPTLLIQDADAIKSKGTMNPEILSKKVCGAYLCSEIKQDESLIGSDRDEHGCIGSAGYKWNEEIQQCQRPWEHPQDQIIIPENGKQVDIPAPSLLFVQLAELGTFQDKDGKKILTFVDVSPTTVFFSDRPYRETGSVTTEEFVASWGTGYDSFADDPPNAALEIINEIGGPTVFIIELLSATYNPESHIVQYEINILEEATEGLSHYVLFNDIKFPGTFDDSVLFVDGLLDFVKKAGHAFDNAGHLVDKGIDVAKNVDLGDESAKLAKKGLDEVKKGDISIKREVEKGTDAVNKELAPLQKAEDYVKSKTIDPITGEVITIITPVITTSNDVFCEVGKKVAGELGCAIGTQYSMQQIGTLMGALTRSDITNSLSSNILPYANAIKDVFASHESNDGIALAVSYNVFTAQDANIKKDFMTFMHGFRDNPAMTKAYDADNFCGFSNEGYFKNILYPYFSYNLQHEFYDTLYDNFESGMSISEVKDDLDKTLNDKVKAVTLYSLIQQRDVCNDQPWDLYSLIYDSIDDKYKDNLVASTRDGETTLPQKSPNIWELRVEAAEKIAAHAQQVLNDLRFSPPTRPTSFDTTENGQQAPIHLTSVSAPIVNTFFHNSGKQTTEYQAALREAQQAADEASQWAARAVEFKEAYAELEYTQASFGLVEEAVSYETSVTSVVEKRISIQSEASSDIEVTYNIRYDKLVDDIESSVGDEAESELNSFEENSITAMDQFEDDIIGYDQEESVNEDLGTYDEWDTYDEWIENGRDVDWDELDISELNLEANPSFKLDDMMNAMMDNAILDATDQIIGRSIQEAAVDEIVAQAAKIERVP